jgi:hypothetical protein
MGPAELRRSPTIASSISPRMAGHMRGEGRQLCSMIKNYEQMGAKRFRLAISAERVGAEIMLDQKPARDGDRASFRRALKFCVVRCKRPLARLSIKAADRRARARRLSSSSKFLADSGDARWIFGPHQGLRREKPIRVGINQT